MRKPKGERAGRCALPDPPPLGHSGRAAPRPAQSHKSASLGFPSSFLVPKSYHSAIISGNIPTQGPIRWTPQCLGHMQVGSDNISKVLLFWVHRICSRCSSLQPGMTAKASRSWHQACNIEFERVRGPWGPPGRLSHGLDKVSSHHLPDLSRHRNWGREASEPTSRQCCPDVLTLR